MVRRAASSSPTVDVPPPEADRPSWVRVGALAAVGFVVGVAWPRVAGVRLGPAVPETPAAAASEKPGTTTATAAASEKPGTTRPMAVASAKPGASAPSAVASASPSVAPSAPPSSIPAALSAPADALRPESSAGASSPVSSAPSIALSKGSIFACRSSEGQTLHGTDCRDLVGLDAIVAPRLRSLRNCPAAAGATGALHIVVRVDFAHGVSAELGRGRGTADPDGLLACAKKALAGTNVSALSHDKSRYSVAYTLTFSGPPSASATPSESVDQTAEVQWDVALVRDAPRNGKVLARLQKGSSVRAGATKDGWVPVHYGDGFANDGWIYRAALGR